MVFKPKWLPLAKTGNWDMAQRSEIKALVQNTVFIDYFLIAVSVTHRQLQVFLRKRSLKLFNPQFLTSWNKNLLPSSESQNPAHGGIALDARQLWFIGRWMKRHREIMELQWVEHRSCLWTDGFRVESRHGYGVDTIIWYGSDTAVWMNRTINF